MQVIPDESGVFPDVNHSFPEANEGLPGLEWVFQTCFGVFQTWGVHTAWKR